MIPEEEVDLLDVLWICGGNHHPDRFRCWKTHPSLLEIPSRYFTVLDPYLVYQFRDCALQPVRVQGLETSLCSWTRPSQILPFPFDLVEREPRHFF
jgi:hypothetical protein